MLRYDYEWCFLLDLDTPALSFFITCIYIGTSILSLRDLALEDFLYYILIVLTRAPSESSGYPLTSKIYMFGLQLSPYHSFEAYK